MPAGVGPLLDEGVHLVCRKVLVVPEPTVSEAPVGALPDAHETHGVLERAFPHLGKHGLMSLVGDDVRFRPVTAPAWPAPVRTPKNVRSWNVLTFSSRCSTAASSP